MKNGFVKVAGREIVSFSDIPFFGKPKYIALTMPHINVIVL
jgi:hypothetical protein